MRTSVSGRRTVRTPSARLRHAGSHYAVSLAEDAADTNDDGKLDIADAVAMLGYLFGGASLLPPPLVNCGDDPTGDELE